MRNPQRWRTVSLAFVASGLICCAAPFVVPPWLAVDNVRLALFSYGLTATVFGLVGGLMCHVALRASRALARGEDLIARWHIDAATWRKFVERNRTLGETSGLRNELSIAEAIPDDGVDVLVGRAAISVGGSIHVLPEVTHAELVEGDPDYIDLHLFYAGGGHGAAGIPHGPTRLALRFPVAPKAWRDARAAVAHFMGLTPRTPDFFHGRGDGSDPEDLNTCMRCGFETYRLISGCPQCGGGMATRRWARRFGAIMLLCGLVIVGIMSVVSYYTVPTLLHPGVSHGGTRFSGSAGQGSFVLFIFTAVLAFGLTAVGYGAYQVKTGKRDRRVVFGMLGLCTILIVIAYAIQLASSSF